MEAVEKASFFPEPNMAEEFYKNHVNLQTKSGLSRKKYCKLNKIDYFRFGYWIKKIKQHNGAPSKKRPPLIAVKLKKDPLFSKSPDVLCTFKFNNGCLLNIYNFDALTHILERMG